jgi:hypothetical protein
MPISQEALISSGQNTAPHNARQLKLCDAQFGGFTDCVQLCLRLWKPYPPSLKHLGTARETVGKLQGISLLQVSFGNRGQGSGELPPRPDGVGDTTATVGGHNFASRAGD